MDYIAVDMEWNQPFDKKHMKCRNGVRLTGEVIQIGAVRLGADGRIADEFDVKIAPQKYTVMHHMVKKVTGITQKELKNGVTLETAVSKFRAWCGDDCVIFTWGPNDMPMLRDNLRFYSLESSWLPKSYNAQCIFNQQTENKGRQYSIDFAVDYFKISTARDRHDALNDAYYTAMILSKLDVESGMREYDERNLYISNISKTDGDRTTFGGYESFSDAVRDKRILRTKCPDCSTALAMGPLVRHGNEFVSAGRCAAHGDFLVKFCVENAADGKFCVTKSVHEVSREQRSKVFIKPRRHSQKRRAKKSVNKGNQ